MQGTGPGLLHPKELLIFRQLMSLFDSHGCAGRDSWVGTDLVPLGPLGPLYLLCGSPVLLGMAWYCVSSWGAWPQPQ